MSKIGRNDPCPCGSGTKYKKCCMARDQERLLQEKAYHNNCLTIAETLREKIFLFMKRSGYDKFLDEAFDEYWCTLRPELEPPEPKDVAYLGFLDWFIHDYPIPGQDQPIIRLYLQSGPNLPSEELQILQDWQEAYISVFQVKDIEPGTGVLLEDIFSGEEFFISDISLSKQVKKWELITTRKIKVLNEWHISGTGTKENPRAKEEILNFVLEIFKQFKKYHPRADIPTCLRSQGYRLSQRILTLQAEPPTLPQFYTSSGEKLEFWEARYDLHDLTAAMSLLDRADDYFQTELIKGEQGKPLEVSYDWLESRDTAAKMTKTVDGVTLTSYFCGQPGSESYRLLGAIQLKPGELKLTAQGEKRFTLGKQLIEALLQGLIEHRSDAVETPEMMLAAMDESKRQPPQKKIPDEAERELLQNMYDQHYQEWLDSPLPILGGKTPRKSVRSKEGRRKVENLLREFEYHHTYGDIFYDISWLRRELKLD